jgi:hypothetical protein
MLEGFLTAEKTSALRDSSIESDAAIANLVLHPERCSALIFSSMLRVAVADALVSFAAGS